MWNGVYPCEIRVIHAGSKSWIWLYRVSDQWSTTMNSWTRKCRRLTILEVRVTFHWQCVSLSPCVPSWCFSRIWFWSCSLSKVKFRHSYYVWKIISIIGCRFLWSELWCIACTWGFKSFVCCFTVKLNLHPVLLCYEFVLFNPRIAQTVGLKPGFKCRACPLMDRSSTTTLWRARRR